MTLKIQTVSDITTDQLHSLIVDNLPALVGDGSEIWEIVPHIGQHSIAAVDLDEDVTVISFHPSDSEQALLAGLSALDHLNDQVASLLLGDYRKPSRLLVLSPTPPPGIHTLAQCGQVDARTFKVIEINGEQGLLLEPQMQAQKNSVATFPSSAVSRPEADEETLSEEEEAFFGQM